MAENNQTYKDLGVDVNWYALNVCGMPDGDITSTLWIDYELTVPTWLQSNWYNNVAILGIILSVSEMVLFCVWVCCQRSKKKEEAVYPGTKTAMEMA